MKWRLDIRIQDAGGRSRAAERHPRDKERERERPGKREQKEILDKE